MPTRDIWVTSDTHFNHRNILTFRDKGGSCFRGDKFPDVNHMNEYMVDKWNSVVKPGDKVYHLGDVFFGDKSLFPPLWAKLQGSKRLVVGNHDDVKYLAAGAFFQKIMLWRVFPDWGLIFTHVPIHDTTLYRAGDKALNVHGHIHQNESPPGSYFNVAVERHDYTPVHIEDLIAKVGK